MTVGVYLVRRPLRGRQRSGRPKYRWALRWADPESCQWKCESTGTADRTEAEALRKLRWAEINGLITSKQPARESEPAAEAAPLPTWQECRDSLERAMTADNLRPSYISDAVLLFDSLQRAFPALSSPADVTSDLANEYKRQRSEGENAVSPWTVRGDLSTLKAVFGKWLVDECGLLTGNPFEKVKPPRCDDPDVRIVTAAETADLFAWISDRWHNWRLPLVYLEVAALVGWRATEIASLRTEDLLDDGFLRVIPESSKTRRHKYGWLPAEFHAELRECSAGGWAFGRFSDELRRRLTLCHKRPNHAARVKDFAPERFVGWLQDELQRYNKARSKEAATANPSPQWEPFTLHDFRRTAITGMQMAGVSEKEASVMVGATPEVIRRHYEKMDQLAIARRNVERRLGADGAAQSFAPVARRENDSLDAAEDHTQTATA